MGSHAKKGGNVRHAAGLRIFVTFRQYKFVLTKGLNLNPRRKLYSTRRAPEGRHCIISFKFPLPVAPGPGPDGPAGGSPAPGSRPRRHCKKDKRKSVTGHAGCHRRSDESYGPESGGPSDRAPGDPAGSPAAAA
eukprot:758553-Hanusia_phi.AAC.2